MVMLSAVANTHIAKHRRSSIIAGAIGMGESLAADVESHLVSAVGSLKRHIEWRILPLFCNEKQQATDEPLLYLRTRGL